MPQVVEQEQELKQQALTVVERAKIVKIQDQDRYDDSATSLLLNDIIPFRKKWEADGIVFPRIAFYSTYKGILNKFNEGDKPAEVAERA